MQSFLDEQQLAELRDLMGPDFAGLVEAFLRDSTERFRSLEAAIAAGQWDQARRQAHSLKGSSSNVGALTLSRQCQTIEHLLVDGTPALLTPAMAELATIVAAVQAELRQQLS